ncbi:hypothetical protein SprV_0301126400 [Sparganum proliferum]
MVGSPVGIRDRLGHQHVPPVSSPDEDIVQRVPLTRQRMYPGGFHSHRKAEEEVGHSDPVLCAGHSRQEEMQVFVEFVSHLLRASHRRMVDADDCGEVASPERQAETPQAIFDALWRKGQGSHDVVPHGKGDARDTSLCIGTTAPEEGVAGTHLPLLALLGKPDLTECSNVHLESHQFSSH